MDRKKKIVIGIAAAGIIIYLATRKKSSSTNATKNGNSFQLASVTNDLWTNGVGISPVPTDGSRDWGTQTQLLVKKAGNEQLLTKIKNGTKLKFADGTTVTAVNILDLNIDEFLRITTVENISGYVNAAGFPNRITVL